MTSLDKRIELEREIGNRTFDELFAAVDVWSDKQEHQLALLEARYNKDMREAAESFKRLKDWFIYFVHCEAVTLEDVMYRKTSSQSQKNRHRGMLYHMLRAYDGADFDRFAYRSINEKAARDVAEKYPYLPSLK